MGGFARYLSADGSPRIDTFIGRARPGTLAGGDARARWAVARARRAVQALNAWDGHFVGQPLWSRMAREGGWLHVRPADRGRVVFVSQGRAFGSTLADDDETLVRALRDGGGPGLEALRLDTSEAVDAAIAISLDDWPVSHGRHVHRSAWSAGGGPWCGVGLAPPYELVTTCHLAVDGAGHAAVAADVLAEPDEGRPWIAALGAPAAPLPAAATQPVGFAAALLDAPVDFESAAYAFGRALDTLCGGSARRSPTFQFPVAPGTADDAGRFRRRVVHGVSAVRRHGDAFEPAPEFAARLRALVAEQRAGGGVLPRLARASEVLPAVWERALLRLAATPRPWLPMIETLAGRGCLSIMRTDASFPLVAASAPALAVTPSDPRGGVVLSLLGRQPQTASLTGTGLVSTPEAARRFLDMWRRLLPV